MSQAPDDLFAKEVLKLWNINSKVSFVRGVENYIYVTEDKTKYLRLTASHHRQLPEIQSELHWVAMLLKEGVSIAPPIHSKNNKLVEAVTINNQELSAVLFQAAPGKAPESRSEFSDKMISHWGKLTGQLHRLTKSYHPNEQKRLMWNKEPGFTLAEQALTPTDPLYNNHITMKNYLLSLPSDQESFGLVHADLHYGNFFITPEYNITLFDFDDCQYHWFVYDIAIIMNSIHFIFDKNAWFFDYNHHFTSFLNAYNKENHLSDEWLQRVPTFSFWRDSLLYFWLIARMNNKDFLIDDLDSMLSFKQRLINRLEQFDSSLLR